MKPITEHSDIIFDSTEYDEYDDYEEYARQFMYSVSGKEMIQPFLLLILQTGN